MDDSEVAAVLRVKNNNIADTLPSLNIDNASKLQQEHSLDASALCKNNKI